MAYTINITPTLNGSNTDVAIEINNNVNPDYAYSFITPTIGSTSNTSNQSGSFYGNYHCTSSPGGVFASLYYSYNEQSYNINTNIATNATENFDPTSACPAITSIYSTETNNFQEISTYNYINECASGKPFSLTGSGINTGTYTSQPPETLSITISTGISYSSSSPPNCSNYSTVTFTPSSGTAYNTTYNFYFGSSSTATISIVMTSLYTGNNTWSIQSINITCNNGYTNNQLGISIGTLCSIFYTASYYESTINTTNMLNYISAILLIAPIIQVILS